MSGKAGHTRDPLLKRFLSLLPLPKMADPAHSGCSFFAFCDWVRVCLPPEEAPPLPTEPGGSLTRPASEGSWPGDLPHPLINGPICILTDLNLTNTVN